MYKNPRSHPCGWRTERDVKVLRARSPPYMQLVSPSVVAMAVRMEMSMLMIIFQVSFLIGSDID